MAICEAARDTTDSERQFDAAVTNKADQWVPACGGTEVPFRSRSGRRLWYLFNPATEQHAYLDCDQDMILTDQEAMLALGIPTWSVGTSVLTGEPVVFKNLAQHN
jgi:hypothetical protein